MRIVLALIGALVLAACGDGTSGTDSNIAATNAAPVANVAAPAGQNWLEVVSKTPEGGYIQGNPNAPIKLVEYGSRSCPVCGHFANTGVEPLRTKYVATGKVSYEFREFFVHPQDLGIGLLGRCVSTEAYFPVLDQMYANQAQLNANAEQVYQQVAQLSAPQAAPVWAKNLGYVDFMKQRGLSEAKANQCLTDQAAIDVLSKQLEAASARGVSGTPTFFINGTQAPDRTVTWEQLEPLLRAAGA